MRRLPVEHGRGQLSGGFGRPTDLQTARRRLGSPRCHQFWWAALRRGRSPGNLRAGRPRPRLDRRDYGRGRKGPQKTESRRAGERAQGNRLRAGKQQRNDQQSRHNGCVGFEAKHVEPLDDLLFLEPFVSGSLLFFNHTVK